MSHPSRIEGYAIISADGMIADADGKQPPGLIVKADQKFFRDGLDRAAAVAHGKFSYERGPKAAGRKRLILSRRIPSLAPHPRHAKGLLWNPAGAPFAEAWRALDVADGTLAVIGGTDTFGLFLTIGYDAFYLTRTDASVPRGRPVFPGVGTVTTPEEVMRTHGLALKDTRMLDPSVNCRVEEWVKA